MRKFYPFIVFVSLLVSTAASAAELSEEAKAEVLAKEAQQAVQEHCEAASGRDARQAAESLAVLSDVWGRLGARAEASPTGPIQYWLGVIAHCVGQTARAVQDLDGFIKTHKGGGRWPELVADAEERIVQIQSREKNIRSKTPAAEAPERSRKPGAKKRGAKPPGR